MRIAILLCLQLLALTFPHPLGFGALLVCSIGIAIWLGIDRQIRASLLAAALTLLPFFMLVGRWDVETAPPQPPAVEQLLRETDPSNYFGPASLDRIARILRGRQPHMDNPEAARILDQAQIPTYLSITILNLNREPVVWKGRFFSNQYQATRDTRSALVMKDGRLFYTQLTPIPSTTQAHGYLVIEAAILSRHVRERADTWLYRTEPASIAFEPVVVDPDVSHFLERLSRSFQVPPPPYDIHFVKEPERAPLIDWLVLAWALFFMMALFLVRSMMRSRTLILFLVGYLLILWLPVPGRLDFLTTFSSYIFGTRQLGNLLSTPFHFFVSAAILFLLFSVYLDRNRQPRWIGLVLFPILSAMLVYAPSFLQKNNVLSYVHPLEAFSSAGAFLSFVSFLSVFVYGAVLLDRIRFTSLRLKFAGIVCAVLLTIWAPAPQNLAIVSLALIWILKDYHAPLTLKAALLTLVFYPYLVIKEQRDETLYVRNNLLDELTLLVERNHFRMGRIIQRLPDLVDQLNVAPHENMMEMFAKQSGLFEDEIDFALRLVEPNEKVVSSIDQHILLEKFPFALGPENRITEYQEGPSDPNWLVFRKILETDTGDYEFSAILANDFQNLSLVRQPRGLNMETIRGESSPSPYFAYVLDVFDLDGNPLYSQDAPNYLSIDDREKLKDLVYFWRTEARNTVFFFKDRSYIYRIIHKATPLRMVFVRYLALWLTLALMLKAIALTRQRGRGPIARWNRSFAMKLAGFMFLSSVLPTFMLGFFLIRSIQRNQVREEAALAQSKILAAKKLFKDYSQLLALDDPELDARLQAARRDHLPGDLPIRKYSRILGEDLILFVAGAMVQTNQPEVFRQGVVDRRLPHDLVKELFLEKKSYSLVRTPLPGGGSMLTAYSAIQIGPNREGVLAMTMIPYGQKQKLRWWEQLEFSVTLLLGLLFLMALLTRFFAKSFLHPVSQITRGAVRMARGLADRPIEIDRQDELQRMVAAFNTMRARIQESQQRLQQQLEILDETLKSMSTGLLGFSGDGRIILANDKVWEILDWRTGGSESDQRQIVPAESLPEDLSALILGEKGLAPLAVLFAKEESGEFGFHIEAASAKRELLAKLRMVGNQEDRGIRWILVIEDITDAVAASRFTAWSEMARRVAHEIKNPLTPIQLEVDHLLRIYQDGHPQFGEALEDATRQIGEQVQDLRRIATEFGDYARPVTPRTHDTGLRSMLSAILDPYRKTLSGVSIQEALPREVIIQADERLLKRAVHNLIVNAIQAMDGEGVLTVGLKQEDDMAVLWVQDTGPGIPPEERHKIFEAYFSTKDHGTGLGMVIARKYIHIHGGALTIDPDYENGTRFLVRLPIEGPKETGSLE